MNLSCSKLGEDGNKTMKNLIISFCLGVLAALCAFGLAACVQSENLPAGKYELHYIGESGNEWIPESWAVGE